VRRQSDCRDVTSRGRSYSAFYNEVTHSRITSACFYQLRRLRHQHLHRCSGLCTPLLESFMTSSHTTTSLSPTLKALHWFPVKQRIEFKLCAGSSRGYSIIGSGSGFRAYAPCTPCETASDRQQGNFLHSAYYSPFRSNVLHIPFSTIPHFTFCMPHFRISAIPHFTSNLKRAFGKMRACGNAGMQGKTHNFTPVPDRLVSYIVRT